MENCLEKICGSNGNKKWGKKEPTRWGIISVRRTRCTEDRRQHRLAGVVGTDTSNPKSKLNAEPLYFKTILGTRLLCAFYLFSLETKVKKKNPQPFWWRVNGRLWNLTKSRFLCCLIRNAFESLDTFFQTCLLFFLPVSLYSTLSVCGAEILELSLPFKLLLSKTTIKGRFIIRSFSNIYCHYVSWQTLVINIVILSQWNWSCHHL